MRRLLAGTLVALVAAPVAAAQPRPLGTNLDGKPKLTEASATRRFLQHPKVEDWLERYPERGRTTDATLERTRGEWTVKVWWGDAGEIAEGKVHDASGAVTEAWTGPQVAWKMARGYDGAFGGKVLNNPLVWLGFCAAFLLGLADLRRPLSLRNLDLLALLSFSVSLAFFNQGDIFTSVPLAYPPCLYLLARMAWLGVRGVRTKASNTVLQAPLWPVWLLAAATVFLVGFRIGLNVTQREPSVIDVGYSGVVGAHRIATGESPYGNFPIEGNRKKCGSADTEGVVRDRVQTNGRCETANERGDTYGPVAYLAYVPGYLLFGWDGRWDSLPAAHFTAIAFDLLALLGLVLVGRRLGGLRLGIILAFAWAAYPFTQYVLSANTNDAIVPALLVWGFWLASSPWGRGAGLALAGLTKFAPLLLVPLWAAYPRALRVSWRFAAGFAAASALALSVLLLEPDPFHAARVFWDRTAGWQLGRESPFSVWGWGQYHADGIPDLQWVQRGLIVLVVAGAVALFFVPRRRSPLQLAALTAAVLIGFELVLEHWFYLYVPWFFPFVAVAVLAPRPVRALPPAGEPRDRAGRELVAAG